MKPASTPAQTPASTRRGTEGITLKTGYQPGLVGRATEMHGRYYARAAGFGAYFESRVAAGLAEFVDRLERPVNAIWAAMDGEAIVGTIVIDGEHAGGAHLRWFIFEDGYRGTGTGLLLMRSALTFCDARGFAQTELSTFAGLDAARRLYDASGFVLVEQKQGNQWGVEVAEQRFVRQAGAGMP